MTGLNDICKQFLELHSYIHVTHRYWCFIFEKTFIVVFIPYYTMNVMTTCCNISLYVKKVLHLHYYIFCNLWLSQKSVNKLYSTVCCIKHFCTKEITTTSFHILDFTPNFQYTLPFRYTNYLTGRPRCLK
jgi:hypothetical protein